MLIKKKSLLNQLLRITLSYQKTQGLMGWTKYAKKEQIKKESFSLSYKCEKTKCKVIISMKPPTKTVKFMALGQWFISLCGVI